MLYVFNGIIDMGVYYVFAIKVYLYIDKTPFYKICPGIFWIFIKKVLVDFTLELEN